MTVRFRRAGRSASWRVGELAIRSVGESTEDCRDPVEVMSDVGVDAGVAGPRAALAERRETDQRPTIVDVVRQRTAAVALQDTSSSPGNYGDRCSAAAGRRLCSSLPTELRQRDSLQSFICLRLPDHDALRLLLGSAV